MSHTEKHRGVLYTIDRVLRFSDARNTPYTIISSSATELCPAIFGKGYSCTAVLARSHEHNDTRVRLHDRNAEHVLGNSVGDLLICCRP